MSSRSKKVDDVGWKIKFVQGAVWVLGGLLALMSAIFAAYLSGKFKITFK